MSTTHKFKDQETRNAIGADVADQLGALVAMLGREAAQDDWHLKNLLNATLPRMSALNNAASALFSDPNAFSGGDLMKTVYGDDVAIEGAAS